MFTKTMCGSAMGWLLALGLWLPSPGFGAGEETPAVEPPPVESNEEAPGQRLPEAGRLPQPMAGGPGPEEPGRFEGQRPRERRLFGQRHPRPTYESMPEEVRLQLEDFMRKHFPELFEELQRLDPEAPEVFLRKVNRLLPQMLQLMRLEHEDPETFRLRIEEVRISTQIRALARPIRRGRNADRKEALVAELRQFLERRFDLRLEMHRIEVERLEHRLAEAREHIDRLAADKDQIIAEELEDTLTPQRWGRDRRGRVHDQPGRPTHE